MHVKRIFAISRMILPASWFPMDPAVAAKLVLQDWATIVEARQKRLAKQDSSVNPKAQGLGTIDGKFLGAFSHLYKSLSVVRTDVR